MPGTHALQDTQTQQQQIDEQQNLTVLSINGAKDWLSNVASIKRTVLWLLVSWINIFNKKHTWIPRIYVIKLNF